MYLYPKWIRLWHLVNALFCLLLIFTGLCLHYSGQPGSIIPFDKAITIHNFGGVALSISYLLFLFGNLFTPNGKHYRIRCKGLLTGSRDQFRYYIVGMLKGEKNPFTVTRENKFNPLQKISYVFIMYICMPLIIITGIDLLFPGFLFTRFLGGNGLLITYLMHIISGFIVTIFLVIHIYFCTLGPAPGSLFMSILSGYYAGDD